MGEDKRYRHTTTRLRMELDTITNNRVHGPIEGHENTPNKTVIVKKDMHGTWDVSRDKKILTERKCAAASFRAPLVIAEASTSLHARMAKCTATHKPRVDPNRTKVLWAPGGPPAQCKRLKNIPAWDAIFSGDFVVSSIPEMSKSSTTKGVEALLAAPAMSTAAPVFTSFRDFADFFT